jgi:glycosyltransferase involved in cell wall biosynthesis
MAARALTVLGFSTSDVEGGSARSAQRIHQGLRRLGHRSRLLVGTKSGTDAEVETTHGGGARRILDRIAAVATDRAGLQYVYYPSSRRVLRHRWLGEADVIQLYNIHGGYVSHRLLPALAARAPIVWRLSDMWAMTGHCSYVGGCERWRSGCGRCPDLKAYPELRFDTSALLWRMKRRAIALARPTIVAPSRWMEAMARASPLLTNLPIHRIGNGVELETFRPVPRPSTRDVLGLPQDATVILFVAHVLDDNLRKGDHLVVEALNRLGPRPGLMVGLAGIGGEGIARRIPQPTVRFGYVRDDRLMAAIYSASDLLLAPSTRENLPNSILEAMACGCPIVAPAVGGIVDAVRDGEAGVLTAADDAVALSTGIARLLDDAELRRRCGVVARARIERDFDVRDEVAAMAAVYGEAIDRRGRG